MSDEKLTATERLRQLLDERGVEWDYGITGADTTRFNANGVDVTFTPMRDGLVCSTILTPEQAVAATLGRGTCRMELPDLRGPAYTDVYVCSECGGEVMVGTVMGVSDVPKWCPWCGRKVES